MSYLLDAMQILGIYYTPQRILALGHGDGKTHIWGNPPFRAQRAPDAINVDIPHAGYYPKGDAMQDKPEIDAILSQVAAEIAAMMAAGENGTVTIHVGRADLHVEVERKRRHPTVRIERTPKAR